MGVVLEYERRMSKAFKSLEGRAGFWTAIVIDRYGEIISESQMRMQASTLY